MDLELARFNMIEQQIRPWEVLDPRVLGLLSQIKREEFVPPSARALAFADLEIPLGHGQVMLSPKLEARLIQSLEVKESDKVLEIGTGSGYMTALLARSAASVESVEIVPELAAFGARNLAAHGIDNLRLHVGDGARGSPGGPFDAIILTGSTPVLAPRFHEMLAPGGRLIAVIGEPPVMKATLFRAATGTLGTELFETVIAPLVNAPQPPRFVF